MNVTELKAINPSELVNKLAELQKSQFDLRMAKGNGQMTKGHVMQEVRRNIARVKTIIKQNEAGNK